MQRVHRKRYQVYEEKDFEIRSLNSLVNDAKKRTYETIRTEVSDTNSIKLPLHGLTERLADNLQHMHHHLQGLFEKKLGPDARHVIAAERARLTQAERTGLARNNCLDEMVQTLNLHPHHTNPELVPEHLSEVGNNIIDELELLNEYRERYAVILADLLVVKERLQALEKGFPNYVDWCLNNKTNDEISDLMGAGSEHEKETETI